MDEQSKSDAKSLSEKWAILLEPPSALDPYERAKNAVIIESQEKALPSVVHCKKSYYDVYVGRPSKFGNPFEIGKDGTREEVIEKYREWFFAQPELMKEAKEKLKGKVLACWCAPQACHADILSGYVNGEEKKDSQSKSKEPV